MSDPVGAVLVAAGASSRMGFDKVWTELEGKPLLAYALQPLADSPAIARVALVVAEAHLGDAAALVGPIGSKVVVCSGGVLRRESVAAGLAELPGLDWIVVHDAARPFLTAELIERGLQAARETGAAVAAVPARDTIKRAADGRVVETLPRSELWLVQTPQIFKADLLRRALRRADPDVTDEATLIERLGGQVRIFPGDERNWKVTTPADFALAEAWLAHGRVRGPRRGAVA